MTVPANRRPLPRTVVCNTGPILALSRVDGLSLIEKVLPSLVIPPAVRDELRDGLGTDERRLAVWLERARIQAPAVAPDAFLAAELDSGEAAVIALAREIGAGVVMDERKGRRVAVMAYGLHVVGTGRILLEAKERGMIGQVRPLVEQMQDAGYYFSMRLKERLFQEAGEA